MSITSSATDRNIIDVSMILRNAIELNTADRNIISKSSPARRTATSMSNPAANTIGRTAIDRRLNAGSGTSMTVIRKSLIT